LTITISIWSWSIKCGNRCVHNCSSLMQTPNPNQKPNGWIQDSSPAAAYKVETTWAFSLVPPTSPPQLAMKVSADGPRKLGVAMSPTPNNLCVVGSIEAHLHPGIYALIWISLIQTIHYIYLPLPHP
jgi:hypothetical protein